jgi:hypothetical protein
MTAWPSSCITGAGAHHGQDNTKWEAQLVRLAAYKVAHGDCSVPGGWAEDRGLGNWVSNQRRWKWKLDRGEPSKGMTAGRAARLMALDFEWDRSHMGGSIHDEAARMARYIGYPTAGGGVYDLPKQKKKKAKGVKTVPVASHQRQSKLGKLTRKKKTTKT